LYYNNYYRDAHIMFIDSRCLSISSCYHNIIVKMGGNVCAPEYTAAAAIGQGVRHIIIITITYIIMSFWNCGHNLVFFVVVVVVSVVKRQTRARTDVELGRYNVVFAHVSILYYTRNIYDCCKKKNFADLRRI